MVKKKFCEFLVKFRWVLIAVFALLTVAGCVLIFFTDIVYDLSAYLPSDSDAKIGMDVLKKEFDDKGMAYAVVENVDKKTAAEISNKLSEIEGVGTVIYVETENYVEGNAMYTLSFEDYDSTENCFATMARVEKFFKDNGYSASFTGQSASSYFTKAETEDSILKLAVVIVVVILVMLVFTGKSYFELVPMIITFVVAIVLNMGTNFFFNFAGGISYISNLVSLVLQLALSIDYSVILIHRFMEEKDVGVNAVVSAMEKGITEIFSSSLTTIAGLIALVFMALPIGREIGISLAKAIVCSLVSVIFLMPPLLSLFKKPLIKTIHKPFVPNVKKFFLKISKAKYVIVPLFIVVVALSGTGQFFNSYSFNMNGGHYIVDNNEKIEELGFGKINSFVVVVPKGDYKKERELASKLVSYDQIDGCNALSMIELSEGVYLTDEFAEEDFIAMIKQANLGKMVENLAADCFKKAAAANNTDKISFLDLLLFVNSSEDYSAMLALLGDYKGLLDQLVYAKGNLEGENYERLTFNICSGVESEETFAFIENAKKEISALYDEYYVTGESVVCYDMAKCFPKDNLIVSLFTVIAVLVILLFTFRNVLIPIILILAIQGGIWINFAIPFLSGTPLSFIGYLIICAVQMGATIDYAIVLTNRFNTIKGNFASPAEAVAEAENLVFPTIITSGVILTLTGAAMALLSSGVVAAMGSLLAIGTALSMFIVLFILPSLLLVSEKACDKCYFTKILSAVYNRKRKAAVLTTAATEETEIPSGEAETFTALNSEGHDVIVDSDCETADGNTTDDKTDDENDGDGNTDDGE